MNIIDTDLISDTPFVAVDLTVMERNIKWLSKLAKEAGVKLRPHTKTHKSPDIAQLQIAHGASGITTATLGEAEVMAEAGIDDILVAFPLIGKAKLQRFAALVSKAKNVMTAFDDIEIAKGISDVGQALGRTIPVYIDIDTGLHRMGRSPEDSVDHIVQIARLPNIEVRGLMSHTGHAYKMESDAEILAVAQEDATLMQQTKEQLQKKGIDIPEISIGATATARFIKDIPYATEMRPGMYVFNDRFVMEAGGATVEDCAVSVFATVVAKPTTDRIIIDAGSKTLAMDPFRRGGHGLIVGHDNLILRTLSEEHGTIEVQGHTDLTIGDVIRIIPNHVCPVINLADDLFGIRDGRLEKMIPVKARGKNR